MRSMSDGRLRRRNVKSFDIPIDHTLFVILDTSYHAASVEETCTSLENVSNIDLRASGTAESEYGRYGSGSFICPHLLQCQRFFLVEQPTRGKDVDGSYV
jgi:hypothetical protein